MLFRLNRNWFMIKLGHSLLCLVSNTKTEGAGPLYMARGAYSHFPSHTEQIITKNSSPKESMDNQDLKKTNSAVVESTNYKLSSSRSNTFLP